MKKICIILYVLSFSCFANAQTKLISSPVVAPEKVLKSNMDFLYYNRDHLRLADDNYIAYSNKGETISKGVFLNLLKSGKYLPVRLNGKTESYQLYELRAGTDKDISTTIAQIGTQYADAYKREGKKFQTYHFVDLNGKVYTPENMIGKIMVLKCWFLACQACREEIPTLNQLTDKYKNRKDIVFVSLVFDKPRETKAFLKKTTFNYAVVPNEKVFMEKTLNVQIYPTHFIINKRGYVVKMVNDPNELITALNKEAITK